ncbi:MAG: nucleotide exchange factor GrpE [bacterium]|nr:nucleotide exchange factor GrpE [bacterium]
MESDQPTNTTEAQDAHAACEERAADLERKWKRALADLVNKDKEFARAREEQAKFATANFARDLLPIVDAVDATSGSPPHLEGEQEGVSVGLQRVRKQLHDFLAAHGVTPVPADGHPDYLLHEVVGNREDATADPGTIVEVAQQGYAMHDRCLRPAKVIVAAEKDASSSDGTV